MATQLHITSSCIMSKGAVIKNDEVIFDPADIGVNEFLPAIYKQQDISYPKFYKMDNLCKLGFLATEILLAGTNIHAYQPQEVGVILSNANSSLDADIRYWQSAQEIPSPALFVYTLPNIVIGEICIRHGFKGEHAFYVMPQFDAEFIDQQVRYLFDNNIVKACIYGWVDVLGDDYEAKLFLTEKDS